MYRNPRIISRKSTNGNFRVWLALMGPVIRQQERA